MRKLLQAAMQHRIILFRTGSSVQALARPSAVVSYHGTTPPPAARQVLRDCRRLQLVNERIYKYAGISKCSTAARSASSDAADSAAAVSADSTDAPAADDGSSTATEAATADIETTTQPPSTTSSSRSEPVQLPGSLRTVWAAFLQQLWERGYFVDSNPADK
jgi:hypothetical protein